MKKSVTQRALAVSAIALAAGMAATSAQAVDYDGYFRAGPGATKKDAARACYNLGGALGNGGGHYRLGNECDFYGEFGLAQTGTVDGVTYKGKIMVNEYNGGTDAGSSSSAFEQMYVEAKGFDISPDTNFWIGKRFYGRADIHILDTFFVKMDGVGAGADNIAVGGGRLGFAYFGSDNGTGDLGGGGTGASKTPAQRVNFDLTGLPVNPGGTLRVTGTFTNGNFTGGKSGFGLSLQHDQDIQGLGSNRVWLQYAQGSAGLNANSGRMTADSGFKQWRLIETLNWQVGPFGGQALALFTQQDKDTVNNIPKLTGGTVGGRVSYAVTKNFKMVAEAGYMQNKIDGIGTQKLAKFTIAPTLSTGPGYWNRPELRFYVTTAKWNSPANVYNGDGSVNTSGGLTGIGDSKTNGTSYGFQAEIWW
ncbi:carbohydrate porin [Paucibacter sp. R3-3]|uniref:Carbohydrate porin n=1 Tax=Roseateles agri TaxID=3098619 RepID=A0ABU5DQJ5_9BURK|nr:carbohydrate porin [Paucibacter sp. R3-3]MDY0748596.1 carbohydrate porin [Paucibacter sp. R3-3]